MKRVLIITYYWPPCGGIGVLRNLKFVKYLRLCGWEPVLFIPSGAHYPYLEPANIKDIPDGIEILVEPIKEPHGLFKQLTGRKKTQPLNNPVAVRDKKPGLMDRFGIWLRGNFFIPDARALWIAPSVKHILRYLEQNPVDVIFSDGPPHTNTRIGTLVRQQTQIPWLADFQDPWSQVDYLQRFNLSKWAWRRHKKMEQEAFALADKITTASPRSAEDLEAIGAEDVGHLYYGYDEEDFASIHVNQDKKFTIVHAGLMGIDRKPDGLIKVLAKLVKEWPEFAKDLELRFAGQVDFEVLEEIKNAGLNGHLNRLGTVQRSQALELICNAQILLLPINKASNAAGRIPAKVFEYLRTARPIIAFGPIESDINDIIKECKAGALFEYADLKGIEGFIRDAYQKFQSGNLSLNNRNKVEQFSNSNITKKLAAYLNELL